MSTFDVGNQGETLVLDYYLERGYFFVDRNYSYYKKRKIGEIDLIVMKDNIIHLVEVKTRQNEFYNKAIEAVTPTKLKCLWQTYQGFLSQNKRYRESFFQFDVATVVDNNITVYPNCYSFDGFV
jgi:putative endonuclease